MSDGTKINLLGDLPQAMSAEDLLVLIQSVAGVDTGSNPTLLQLATFLANYFPSSPASQAEAEAGADNAKWMSPLRVAQAIAVPANTPVGARVPLEEGGEWRPPLPTDESIDADTQLAIIAPLGYTLNQLQPAMIRQMNMIAEGSKLEGLDIRGLATEAQQARLSYLKDFLDFVDDCRAHGAERKSNPEMPAAYPTPPTEVN